MLTVFVLQNVWVFLLIFTRVVSFVGIMPGFPQAQIPGMVKVLFSFFLSMVLYNSLPHPALSGTLSSMIVPLFLEAGTGFAIGVVANALFLGIQFAGELLDVQTGFSMSSLVSPGTIGPTSLITNLYTVLFTLWFFSVDGHDVLFLALFQSFHVIPLGQAHFGAQGVSSTMLDALASLTLLGVEVAAPILLALFLTNVSLAVASRAVPQMNVFFVGLPITLFVGLALILLLIPDLTVAFSQVMLAMNEETNRMIQMLGGSHP